MVERKQNINYDLALRRAERAKEIIRRIEESQKVTLETMSLWFGPIPESKVNFRYRDEDGNFVDETSSKK
jgi:hypothetical protein